MFYLKNLSSTEIFQGNPWDIKVTIPPKVRADKKLRDTWINRPATKHCVYNLWEGINANLRVTTRKNSENPPYKLHGLALDLDPVDPMSEAQARKVADKLKWPVAYLEKTLSPGHWRLIVLFEKALTFASSDMAIHFLKQLYRKENLGRIPDIDKNAFHDPTRYYTSSGEFIKISDKRAEHKVIHGRFLSIFEDYNWREFKSNWEIPPDVIEEALSSKYPRFKEEWPVGFDFETQGPSFWIEGSTSPKSAIAKPHGFYTFSDHAEKPFYTWAELLGADFVEEYQETALSDAVEGVFRINDRFYRKNDAHNTWGNFSKQDIAAFLRVQRNLSDSRDDTNRSPVERAIEHITEHQMLLGAGPCVFLPDGPINVDGKMILNTCTTKPLTPAEGKQKWGPKGNFKWMSNWLDNFFTCEEAKMRFLYWASYAYKSFLSGKPLKGHAILMLGGVRIGKTLLNSKALPDLFGGSRDCKAYLQGDRFGGELWDAGYFRVDDGDVASSAVARKQYGEGIKRLVANVSFRCHFKGLMASEVYWFGRLGITGNDDPESLRYNLPFIDHSMRDKIMLFHCVKTNLGKVDFAGAAETIDKELPYFAAYLLQLEIPEELREPPERFGVKPYHDPALMEACFSVSSSSSFIEILNDWKQAAFRDSDQPYWEGTAIALTRELESLFADSPSTKKYLDREDRVAIELEKLVEMDMTIEHFPGEGLSPTTWRIYRDEEALYQRETRTSKKVDAPMCKDAKRSKFQRSDTETGDE